MAVSKFTANEEQNRLYVFCTEAEWKEFLAVINQLESEMGETAPFVRMPLEHLDPQEAIDQLVSLQSSESKSAGVRFAPTDGAILVMGASEQMVREFKALVTEIDRAANSETCKPPPSSTDRISKIAECVMGDHRIVTKTLKHGLRDLRANNVVLHNQNAAH